MQYIPCSAQKHPADATPTPTSSANANIAERKTRASQLPHNKVDRNKSRLMNPKKNTLLKNYIIEYCNSKMIHQLLGLEKTQALTTQRKNQKNTSPYNFLHEVTSIVYGWLHRSLENTVTRFDQTGQFLIRLFLTVFDQFYYKISGNAVKQTTHDAKSKQTSFKKLKDRKRK